jgi:hypothetical protein
MLRTLVVLNDAIAHVGLSLEKLSIAAHHADIALRWALALGQSTSHSPVSQRLYIWSELQVARTRLSLGAAAEARSRAGRASKSLENLYARSNHEASRSPASYSSVWLRILEWDRFRVQRLLAEIDAERGDALRASAGFERAISGVPPVEPMPSLWWRNHELFLEPINSGDLSLELARALVEHSEVLRRLNDIREARIRLERAVAILEALMSERADDLECSKVLAEARSNLSLFETT